MQIKHLLKKIGPVAVNYFLLNFFLKIPHPANVYDLVTTLLVLASFLGGLVSVLQTRLVVSYM